MANKNLFPGSLSIHPSLDHSTSSTSVLLCLLTQSPLKQQEVSLNWPCTPYHDFCPLLSSPLLSSPHTLTHKHTHTHTHIQHTQHTHTQTFMMLQAHHLKVCVCVCCVCCMCVCAPHRH